MLFHVSDILYSFYITFISNHSLYFMFDYIFMVIVTVLQVYFALCALFYDF